MSRPRARRRPSRCTSISRSASRSARTATSWSSRERRRAAKRSRVGQFLEAVLREIDLRADALDAAFAPRDRRSASRLSRRRHAVAPAGRRRRATRSRGSATASASPTGAEVTLEANPGPDERGDPAALRRAGVTRISFGAQSFDDTELRRLGRRHRGRGCRRRRRGGARRRASASVNVDLLYDIPGRTWRPGWRRSTRRSTSAPDHLSLYGLTLDDPDAEGLTGARRRPPAGDARARAAGGTASGRARTRTARRPSTTTRVVTLADAGFRGYEISNWARPGHESRHNLAYWQRRPHEAVGPGAHAFDGVTRRWNAARLDGYVAALADGAVLPPGGIAPPLDPDAAATRGADPRRCGWTPACRWPRPMRRRSRTTSAGRSPPSCST